jgi:chemotaxis protein CheX
MILTKSVNDLFNGTIESVKLLLPFELTIDQPSTLLEPLTQHPFGVLIGMKGNISGKIIIDASEEIFQKIGERMFGMILEGEMLESFAGELGNMLAGSLSTSISNHGFEIDITPPTILVKESLVNRHKKAYQFPFYLHHVGSLYIIFMIDYLNKE